MTSTMCWQLDPLGGGLPLAWLFFPLFIAILALDHLYFIMIPLRAIRKYEVVDPGLLTRKLERVMATPSMFGRGQKVVPLIGLSNLYLMAGRYRESADCCESILKLIAKLGGKNPKLKAVEGDTRRRYADCLDALDRPEEAKEQRRLANLGSILTPNEAIALRTRGQILERENRHAEAFDVYLEALNATPPSNQQGRAECTMHLCLTSFNAGRTAESLSWAEKTIAADASEHTKRLAHRMAGVACSSLGRLDDAESHHHAALTLAEAGGSGLEGEKGDIMSTLADLLRKRGRLSAAFEAARKAEIPHLKGARMALIVQYKVLRHWGRLEEARETLRRATEASKLMIPSAEARMQAVMALESARIEALAGRGDEARSHLDRSFKGLASDPKLNVQCLATAAWVHAVCGSVEQSCRFADRAEQQMEAFLDNRGIVRGVLYDLAMAEMALDHPTEAEALWTQYLELEPDPVHRPVALEQRGECRESRGDFAAARLDYRAAIDLQIDSHHARLAASRLRQMSLA